MSLDLFHILRGLLARMSEQSSLSFTRPFIGCEPASEVATVFQRAGATKPKWLPNKRYVYRYLATGDGSEVYFPANTDPAISHGGVPNFRDPDTSAAVLLHIDKKSQNHDGQRPFLACCAELHGTKLLHSQAMQHEGYKPGGAE